MTTRPCPTCGTAVPTTARFCGQCGTTIDLQGVPPPRAATQVGAAHAPITTPAPGLPDEPSGLPTPIVPPETALAQMKAEHLAKTLNDPEQERRARQMVDEALAQRRAAAENPRLDMIPTRPAEQVPEAVAALAKMNKTMLLGGEAPAPVPATATTEPRQADQSPLSKSVLAPSSWFPPPPDGGAHAPPPSPGLGPSAPTTQQAAVAAPAPPEERAAPRPTVQQMAVQPSKEMLSAASSAKKTIVGIPAKDLAIVGPNEPAPAPAQQAPPPAAGPPGALKTMLGVAVPGIAPVAPGVAAPSGVDPTAPMSAKEAAPNAPMQLPSRQGTMLGVAAPQVLPPHAQVQQPLAQQYTQQAKKPHYTTGLAMVPPVVPPPAPLVEEALPDAPAVPRKGGVSALLVVGIVFAVVLVGGSIAAVFALRSGAPLTAQPQLDESGKESLVIGCPTCPDDTTVTLGASNAKFAGGKATLALPAPLSIGENDLTLRVDRPGSGRDEDVKVHVPVAYRVRADLTTLVPKSPVITVRVEALPGSEVKIDDKPLPLDASGKANYPIDVAADIEGTSDDAKTIDKKIAFTITPKGGKPETGQLFAKTTVMPLHLDAPGLALVTEKATVAVSGQTRVGGTVTIDGAPAVVDAKGRFGVRVELGGNGDRTLEIVASGAPFSPRVARVKVTRTASVEASLKELEAQGPLPYAQFANDAAAKAGQKALVEGEVVEARATQGYTVILVDEKKSCPKGQPCLVRLVHGEEDRVSRGDTVRAVGRIVGVVNASGKTVPDVEAIALVAKAAK